MEAVKIFENVKDLNWFYDEEADVLYVAEGEPRPAEGLDLGEGVIARLDPKTNEIVGVTVVGMRRRLLKELTAAPAAGNSRPSGQARPRRNQTRRTGK